MKIFIFVTIPLRTTSISVKRPQFEIHHFRDEPSFDISKNPVHLILPANKNESKMQSVSFKLRAIIPPPSCLVSITNERVRRRNGGGSKDQHEVIISRTKGAHNAPPLPFSLSFPPPSCFTPPRNYNTFAFLDNETTVRATRDFCIIKRLVMGVVLIAKFLAPPFFPVEQWGRETSAFRGIRSS